MILFLFSRCNIFRCQEKVLVTWQITWPSRWMTLTPSQCQSRASHRQNVGRTCTSCSTSTLSSPIPLESWRKAHQRTASQVGLSFSSQPASNSYRLSHPCISFLLYLTFNTILPLIISLRYCCTFFDFPLAFCSSLQTLHLYYLLTTILLVFVPL